MPAAASPRAMELPPVEVSGQRGTPATGTIGEPPPAFGGGQVATGGRLGVLGNRNVFDTPFSQTNYTDQLIRDQQARTVLDVLANNPAVRPQTPAYGFADVIRIRGFLVNPQDFAFDGLYGIVNRRRTTIEGIERIEVLSGPAALLYGFPPTNSVGGIINLVPKRAGNEPIARVTADYFSRGNVGANADVAHRFGEGDAFGVRLNAAYRDGDTPLNHQTEQLGVVTAGFDWRGDKLRVSADLGYQHLRYRAGSQGFSVLPGFNVPPAPSLSSNVQQRSEDNPSDHVFGLLRAEYDIAPNVTAFAAFGGSRLDETFVSYLPTILNARGDLRMQSYYQTSTPNQRLTGEAGLRGRFETGPVQHTVTLAGTYFHEDDPGTPGTFGASLSSNLYAPLALPRPVVTNLQRRFFESTLTSVALTDAMSALDGRVQVIAGGREVRAERPAFSSTGARTSGGYDQTAFTPLGALLVRPWQPLSLYVSYAEGFNFGPTPPGTATNNIAIFPPIRSRQTEVGAKVDYDTVGATLALYQITQPSGFLDPVTRIFGINGEQRNRGIDVNVFGSPVAGTRLLGGVSFLQGVQTSTAGGVNNGKTAPGVPNVQLNVGGEHDISFVPGLTASARVIYTSRQYVDLANTQQIPGWARLDLGARYRFELERRNWVARFDVQNVAGANYWASASAGSLYPGTPRTFLFSLSVDL